MGEGSVFQVQALTGLRQTTAQQNYCTAGSPGRAASHTLWATSDDIKPGFMLTPSDSFFLTK